MDKAASREENMPTRGASKEVLKSALKSINSKNQKNPFERQLEESANPCNQSGRLEAYSNEFSTPSTSLQASKPSSISVFNSEHGIPLGKEFGQLYLDHNFDQEDYNKRKGSKVTFEKIAETVSSSQAPHDDVPRRST